MLYEFKFNFKFTLNLSFYKFCDVEGFVTAFSDEWPVLKKYRELFVGAVWPGDTTFVDFLHPNASKYWGDMLEMLYKKIQFFL